MQAADALSRRPDHQIDAPNNVDVTILPTDLWVSATSAVYEDEEQTIHLALQNHNPPPFHTAAIDWEVTTDDQLHYKQRLYVPPAKHLDTLHFCHDHCSAGHPGIQRTLELVERSYWWPSLSAAV